MKRIWTAALMCMMISPAIAQNSVVTELEETRKRLDRMEALADAQTAGFYFGGALECGPQIPEDAMKKVFSYGSTDPEIFAAFAQGIAAAGVQNTFNTPTRQLFCERLKNYRDANDLY